MTDKEAMDRILKDLELRGITLAGVIGVDSKNGQLRVITYDSLGLVDSITQGDNAITLYGKASANTGAMRELFTLSNARTPVTKED